MICLFQMRLIGPLQDRLWSAAGFCVGGTGRCRKIYGRCRNEDALPYTAGIMAAAGYLWSLLEIYGLCRKIMAVAGIHLNCPKMWSSAGKTLILLISQDFLSQRLT